MPLFFPAAFRDIPGLMPKQSDLSRFIRLTGRNGEPMILTPPSLARADEVIE